MLFRCTAVLDARLEEFMCRKKLNRTDPLMMFLGFASGLFGVFLPNQYISPVYQHHICGKVQCYKHVEVFQCILGS